MALERWRYSLCPLESPERQIRLLSVEASRDKTRIEYKLQTCQLGSSKHFYALSYEWGPEYPTKDILINGMAFRIRSNLKAFLDRIYSAEEEFIRPLWIDAICIDQQNLTERNAQVKIMGSIFSHAELVLTWLGNQPVGEGVLTQATFCLEEYRRSMEYKLLQSSKRHDDDVQAILSATPPRILSLAEPYGSLWSCINRISELAYWGRLWIVQELIQAKNLLLLWGDEEITWKALSVAFETLDISSTNRCNSQQGLRPWDLITNSIPFKIWQHKEGGQAHFLLEVMDTFRLSECSVLHDKAYALRGICSDADLLQIDYDKSLDDLFVDLMSLLSNKDQCLRYSHLLMEALQLDAENLTCSSIKLKPLRGHSVQCDATFVGQVMTCKTFSPDLRLELIEVEMLEMLAMAGVAPTADEVSRGSQWAKAKYESIKALASKQGPIRFFWLSSGRIGASISNVVEDDLVYGLPGLSDESDIMFVRIDGNRSPIQERHEPWTGIESPQLSSPTLSSVFSDGGTDTVSRVWVSNVAETKSAKEQEQQAPLKLSLAELVAMNKLLDVELGIVDGHSGSDNNPKMNTRRAQSDTHERRSQRAGTISNSIDQALRVAPGRMAKSSTWPSPAAGQVFIDAMSRDLRENLFLSQHSPLNLPD